MGEQSYLVVHQLQAHAVQCAQELQRHIRSNIHRTGVMLITSQRHIVGSHHVDFRFLAGSTRIKRGLHCPIMGKGCLLLAHHAQRMQPH